MAKTNKGGKHTEFIMHSGWAYVFYPDVPLEIFESAPDPREDLAAFNEWCERWKRDHPPPPGLG